jgi:hypothetical protein
VIHGVSISVELADIRRARVDMIALKYAQAYYGADLAVSEALGLPAELGIGPGEFRVVETQGAVDADLAVFFGVETVWNLTYGDVREFGTRAVRCGLARPDVRSLAFTIHGPGFGLDESDAFLAQLTGALVALEEHVLGAIDSISFVDVDYRRVERLTAVLAGTAEVAGILGSAGVTGTSWAVQLDDQGAKAGARDRLQEASTRRDPRKRVFVAMPFAAGTDDRYHYGIYSAVRDAGFICERIDATAFTGDVLEQIKRRIETAAAVVADLDGSNANVFLEVGFAWGAGIPTILLAPEGQKLPFDVQGQRCLFYKSIRALEESLGNELTDLNGAGQLSLR